MDREPKLLTCTFDNGVRPCIATVYNFYPTLVLLGLVQISEIPITHTICWIRDYGTNKIIGTLKELREKIEQNVSDLRISFFSHEPVNGLKKVRKLTRRNKFPIVSFDGTAPPNIQVYTIWWHDEKPRIIKSGINENPASVMNLFKRVRSGYIKYYMWDHFDSDVEEDKKDGYSSF
jgi:hypothetical protein